MRIGKVEVAARDTGTTASEINGSATELVSQTQMLQSEVSRFLYATGFSGHGFLQAPAVGEVIRDQYLGRAPVVDTAPLSADRFTGSATRPEWHIV